VSTPNDAWLGGNRALWDEWTAIHERSEFYDLDEFRRGGIRLREYEIAEIGPVDGKDLLHLQCHFGIDSLSWARLGARVTGADFSPRAIALARSLANELHLEARFVESNLYDLPANLDGDFDVVYTSRGVLGWLPDIHDWARVVAHFVRPGGLFYITEIHPVANAFENEGVQPGELRLAYPY
jgi:2-polyprenyl-3-methyl-5-hydroxy-6-metoxy-1,4-benzoquinol methylase